MAGFLVSGVAGCGAPTASATATPRPGAACLAAPAGGPYLRAGAAGFECAGTPVTLTGFTFYPALAGGTKAWHDPSFGAYIDGTLDMGAAAGQNLIRPTDEWDKGTPNQDPSDPVVWANLDHLVSAARQRGFFVVLDLSAYRWLLMSQGRDPWDAANWTDFLAAAGARYRNAGAVAFYSISGEPSPPTDETQKESLLEFYRTTTAALRAADPNHLVTVGGFNHMEDSANLGWWQAIDALPGNDIVAVKTYSQHDIDLMPSVAAYARSIGKPVVDEEFGMPQRYGDAAFAGGSPYNGLADGRAAFFTTVYATGRSLGFGGYVFWNLGCETGPDSYEVSPRTPATWGVVARFAATSPRPDRSATAACQ